MTTARPEVRRQSIRVALTATAVVAIVYLIISAAVVIYVTNNLTAQVDRRLTDAIARTQVTPDPDDEPGHGRPDEEVPLGPQRAMWTIAADGTITSNQTQLSLPAAYFAVTTPTTVVIDGNELRIGGAEVDGSHIVVGESLDGVNDARSTVILGVVLVAPILLVAVFVGAVAIGQRVAAPIERARQRQLDFTADASHELRTPLSVIEANASLALTEERDAEWYRGTFVKVDAESKRMRVLLDDLLWLARFDAAHQPANAEPVDLGVLSEQAADRFGPLAEAQQLTLTVSTSEGALVNAPPEWLDRLLGVLIDNACKYSPDGGAVTVRVENDRGRVSLTVDDAGPGVPEEQRGRIFDRFHRATETGAPGAGLGLSIGDAIVRATGGRWSVATSPLGGARMSVSWPRGGAAA